MQLSMYQASVPHFISGLTNLSALLDKAKLFAESKKIEPSVLINARLAPDMFALARQVQIATDIVKGGAARLAGLEVPSFPDTETTFEQLQKRIADIIAFLQSIPAEKIEGSDTRAITLKVGGNEMHFDGLSYLFRFVITNFYFHISMAYAILRHNGVPLGKMDYLGNL